MKQQQYESDRQCVIASLQFGGVVKPESADLEQAITTYARLREERIMNFVDRVKTKHREYLEHACPVV